MSNNQQFELLKKSAVTQIADDLEQAVATSETNSAISASESLASKNLAERWASEDEDVEVEGGKFSSFHYAEKSEASAAESEAQVALATSQADRVAQFAQDVLGQSSRAESFAMSALVFSNLFEE